MIYVSDTQIKVDGQTFHNAFAIGDTVYFRTDLNGQPCLVIGFQIEMGQLRYLVCPGLGEDVAAHEIELTAEKPVW